MLKTPESTSGTTFKSLETKLKTLLLWKKSVVKSQANVLVLFTPVALLEILRVAC
jgi:hypothetical protein